MFLLLHYYLLHLTFTEWLTVLLVEVEEKVGGALVLEVEPPNKVTLVTA